MATIALFLLKFLGGKGPGAFILLIIAKINIILGSFNLIPIPPLDGSRVLLMVLPDQGKRFLISMEPYGFYIIIALLFTGVLYPVISFIQNILLYIIGLIL
ncbi:MAG: site-2 protease family protein [Candidatus Omnitrophica bacterium]|nr:site-2 protease family protein [Candidatus Omnitrophota bacterium]